jgi:hypothetical protein
MDWLKAVGGSLLPYSTGWLRTVKEVPEVAHLKPPKINNMGITR